VNKVDRRKVEKSVVRVPVLTASLVLLAAGCMVLGFGSRSRTIAPADPYSSGMPSRAVTGASLAAFPAIQSAAAKLPVTKLPMAKQGATANARSLFEGLPLIFEPNQGQANLDPADSRARFIAHGTGYTLLLGAEGAILSLRAQTSANLHSDKTTLQSLQMKLAGANPHAALTGSDLLPGKSNYLLGNDPSKWQRGVSQFARVRYEDVYPGINLVFYGNQGHLEYDFQVAPGADPAEAELEFNGAKGLELKNGALVIKSDAGDVRLEAPRVYQQIAGREQAVNGSFVLRASNRAGFAIGTYDHSRELVIDPALFFSTYFGGTGNEVATSIAVDGSGNIYIAGSTTSTTLPAGVPGGTVFQPAPAGPQNVYIAKINPILNPATLEYVTFLGGNGTDIPAGIDVDGAGDPYVAGTTTSTNFPFSGTAYQTVPETGSTPTPHVFVTELNPTASALQYSTYLSGNGTDIASGMTIDGSGNVYVTGTTTSIEALGSTDQFPATNLPNPQPFQSTSQGAGKPQFFVTKVDTFNAGNGSVAYSSYFGASNTANGVAPIAVGGGVAVDANGNMYFDGTTNYTYSNGAIGDFPILNAFQPCLDQPGSIQIGVIPNCTIASTQTLTDAFAAKINPNNAQGSQLQWSTYLGGSQTDSATGIGLDPQGATNVYIVGTTNSPDVTSLTTTNFGAFQICLDTPVNPLPGTGCTTPTAPAPTDAYVARLTNPTSSSTTGTTNMSLSYFSYLGGGGNEAGLAITVDNSNGALVTGWTQSGPASPFPVFPSPNIQGTLTGLQDAFAARLNTNAVLQGQANRNGSWATYFGGTNTASPGVGATTQGTGIALDVNQDAYFSGNTNAIDLQVTGMQELVGGNSVFVNTNAGGFDAFATELIPVPTLTITGVLTLGANQTFISAGNPATFTYTITNTGADLATNITFTDNLNQAITIVPVTFVSATATSGTCSTASTANSVSCVIQSLQSGSTATVTVIITPTASNTGQTGEFNGGAVQVMGPHNNVLASTTVPANMSDFRLSVNPANVSVAAAGDPAVYQVQLTPNPVYGTNITLSCTGVPPGAACSFAPSGTITLLGPGAGAVTLNLTTTARPINIGSVKSVLGHIYAVWFAVPALALLGVGVGGGRRRRPLTGKRGIANRRGIVNRGIVKMLVGMLMLYALLALLLPLPACNGTSNRPPTGGTPSGNFSITVTAASGSDTKSQGIELSVP
jgi:uncharacterized repeat protein (TIGR01451 family)